MKTKEKLTLIYKNRCPACDAGPGHGCQTRAYADGKRFGKRPCYERVMLIHLPQVADPDIGEPEKQPESRED